MPLDPFESMSYLPMPRLDVTREHFEPFVEVYAGQVPNEANRPSQRSHTKEDSENNVDKKNVCLRVVK